MSQIVIEQTWITRGEGDGRVASLDDLQYFRAKFRDATRGEILFRPRESARATTLHEVRQKDRKASPPRLPAMNCVPATGFRARQHLLKNGDGTNLLEPDTHQYARGGRRSAQGILRPGATERHQQERASVAARAFRCEPVRGKQRRDRFHFWIGGTEFRRAKTDVSEQPVVLAHDGNRFNRPAYDHQGFDEMAQMLTLEAKCDPAYAMQLAQAITSPVLQAYSIATASKF